MPIPEYKSPDMPDTPSRQEGYYFVKLNFADVVCEFTKEGRWLIPGYTKSVDDTFFHGIDENRIMPPNEEPVKVDWSMPVAKQIADMVEDRMKTMLASYTKTACADTPKVAIKSTEKDVLETGRIDLSITTEPTPSAPDAILSSFLELVRSLVVSGKDFKWDAKTRKLTYTTPSAATVVVSAAVEDATPTYDTTFGELTHDQANSIYHYPSADGATPDKKVEQAKDEQAERDTNNKSKSNNSHSSDNEDKNVIKLPVPMGDGSFAYVIFPKDYDEDDLDMISTIVLAYKKRKKKKAAESSPED